VTFAVGTLGYVIGTTIAARMVMRDGLDRTIGIGTMALATGGLAMAAVVALGLTHVGWLVGAMMIYLTGLGLALPQAMAGAMTPFPDRAGTASSLMGFAQQSTAAIAAAVIGLYLGRSAWPVAGVVAAMGCLFQRRLAERFANHPFVGDIRGRGLFRALELVEDRASKRPFNPALKVHARIKSEAMARGLMVYPMGGTIDGAQGDHVLLAPPFIVNAAQIETIVERLGEAVDAALGRR